MDASILMSSEYVQPLVPTDLTQLVDNVFSIDGSTQLRHLAALKCAQWCRKHHRDAHFQTALMHLNPNQSSLTPVLTVNPFSRRQRWGPLEVSSWADCLRQSLEAEQIHHLHQRHSALEFWKRQRPSNQVRGRSSRSSRDRDQATADLIHQDPLGLLNTLSRIKRNGQLTVELLSSLGFAGCVAAWITRPERHCRPGIRLLSRFFSDSRCY